jgi:hypothetical protein
MKKTICSERVQQALIALAQATSAEYGEHVHVCAIFFTTEEGKMEYAEVLSTFGNNPEGVAMSGNVMENIGRSAMAEELGAPPETH